MKKYKNKIIAGIIIAIILALAFFGGSPSVQESTSPQQKEALHTEQSSTPVTEDEVKETKPQSTQSPAEEAPVKDKYTAEPAADEKPLPTEVQEEATTLNKEHTCTLSVRCDTILKNLTRLDEEKTGIVPKDGVIFKETEVIFHEGESVFDLLLREMKQNKIHMEFENTPMYNSAYIEGIANLYEFDCGELSGWMYRVNGWFPNYGCSRYALKDGDKVEWVYTCDLGSDVGGSYFAQNGS